MRRYGWLIAALLAGASVPSFAAPDPQVELGQLEAKIQSAATARRWDEAIALGRTALAIEEKSKGVDHPEVGGTLSLIAGWLVEQGKPADATPLYVRAYDIFQRKLGPDDELTEQAASNLAANLQTLGRSESTVKPAKATLSAD